MDEGDGGYSMMAAAASSVSPLALRNGQLAPFPRVPENESASFMMTESVDFSVVWEAVNGPSWEAGRLESHSHRLSDGGVDDSRRRHGSCDALHLLRSSESFCSSQASERSSFSLANQRSYSVGTEVHMLTTNQKRKPEMCAPQSFCGSRAAAARNASHGCRLRATVIFPARVVVAMTLRGPGWRSHQWFH